METYDEILARAQATIASVQESLARTLEIIEDAKTCKSQKSKEVLVMLVNKQLAKYATDPIQTK